MIDSMKLFVENHAINILIILVVGYVTKNIAHSIIKRVIRSAIRNSDFKTARDERQRENTLIGTISTAVSVAIWIITGLLALGEAGIDIAPLLAGAGIAGVALGFGAQSMVRDFLSGMFILLENQYRVGDVVRLNNEVSGSVERVTLRQTSLRDLDGMLHHVPNGEIRLATNMTMEFANVNLDVNVGYDTDLEKLEVLINKIGSEMKQQEPWSKHIIDAPTFLRVNNFAESGLEIKITGKTQPMKHWAVTGELRKRLILAFRKNNIEIPYPHRVLHNYSKASRK